MSIGRNDPCPCGSGKKYKKCCIGKGSDSPEPKSVIPVGSIFAEEEIDELSNECGDLIQAGKYDEAEKLCERLLKEFPDMVDGFMRFNQLYSARGDMAKTVEYAEKEVEFMKNHDGFDPDHILELEDKLLAMKEKL